MSSTSVYQLKEAECPGTPLFLFDCTWPGGDVQQFSTHAVSWNGKSYAARVLDHNAFEFQNGTADVAGSSANLRVLLANADALMSEVEQTIGWKGAQVVVTFLFFDLQAGTATSEGIVVFRGMANPVDEATESTLQLSFVNRLNLQRSHLPAVRIQRNCPWAFPATNAQMQEAIGGGKLGTWSRFYRCGYSAGLPGGTGNLDGLAPFTECAHSRTDCQQRGMFNEDNTGQVTRRFGGMEFVPPSIMVRSYGERGQHLSPVMDNVAIYNDFVPLVYGTGWFQPPIVFARNDGNLTRMEVLLGSGPIDGVSKVIVNGVEVPAGQANTNMTATGWYSTISTGTRNGAFNLDFCDSTGNPLGDPYGSMAFLSVVVPNVISNLQSLPEVSVLVRGLHVSRYDSTGTLVDTAFSNNPAWVLLDVLLRAGWDPAEINVGSFVQVAQGCDQLIPATDLNGNPTLLARYQCNLIVTRRRSVGDLIRGMANGSGILLTTGDSGLLEVTLMGSLASQQGVQPPGSNSTAMLNNGWPAYEFGDTVFSGIARRSDGCISLRVSSRPLADTANRLTVEFQDEFNEYQQDSLSVSDLDDMVLTSTELTAALQALGIPNFNQASRVLTRQLNKAVNGNTFVEFETSVRAAGLKPGHIITLTYAREGWNRQPFRITSISAGVNYRTAAISAQIHDDAWYSDTATLTQPSGRRQAGAGYGIPAALLGTQVNVDGTTSFGITELQQEQTDGTVSTLLTAAFVAPRKTTTSIAAIPLISLTASVDTTTGTLPGGRTYYYGVSAVDANGGETALSFTVTATIPAGSDTNTVTLEGLSFSAGTATLNVYRGSTPQVMCMIASAAAGSATFADPGLPDTAIPVPDPNYDHANFYWRMETQPEVSADQFSVTTIGNSTLQMPVNGYVGLTVRIFAGTGAGQELNIASNSAQVITTLSPWAILPDATSVFAVTQPGWLLGGTTTSSQIQFQVPTKRGSTVEICGRSANVYNQECTYATSPVTRWQIGVGGSSLTDSDVPVAPSYLLRANGNGSVDVLEIGFSDLADTTTITSGTLTLFYWSELNGVQGTLAADLDGNSGACTPGPGATFHLDDVLQIDKELMLVAQAPQSDGNLIIDRGVLGSAAAAHTNGAAIYVLARRTSVLPFPEQFFGSPASAAYSYNVSIPDVRIAAAELSMTNRIGAGPVQAYCFVNDSLDGLRTLCGGQICFQVTGAVAVQHDAAPKVTVDQTRSIGSVSATVNTAPSGGPITVAVTQNESAICSVTIPDGATSSNAVDGASLGLLIAGATLNVSVVAAPSGTNTMPGQDLTVTISL